MRQRLPGGGGFYRFFLFLFFPVYLNVPPLPVSTSAWAVPTNQIITAGYVTGSIKLCLFDRCEVILVSTAT